MTAQPACACLNVKYAPKDNGDGTLSERWACSDCGTEFVKDFRYRALLDLMANRELNIQIQHRPITMTAEKVRNILGLKGESG